MGAVEGPPIAAGSRAELPSFKCPPNLCLPRTNNRPHAHVSCYLNQLWKRPFLESAPKLFRKTGEIYDHFSAPTESKLPTELPQSAKKKQPRSSITSRDSPTPLHHPKPKSIHPKKPREIYDHIAPQQSRNSLPVIRLAQKTSLSSIASHLQAPPDL